MVKRFSQRRAGFTLIEVMLVLGILLLLGTVGVVSYSKIKTSANIDATKALVQSTEHAVQLYQMQMNEVPDDEQGLKALTTPPDDEKLKAKWMEKGPFLDKGQIPSDPWANELKYVKVQTTEDTTGVLYHVYSFGPNKTDDNGTGDDIPAWAETTK